MLLNFARVTNFCWFGFKWGLVLGVIGVVGAVLYLNHRMDEEIRCCVRERIASHYSHLEVSVRSAALVEGKGIEVRGLSLLERGAEGPRAELVYLDEVLLECGTDLQELVAGEPQVSHVTIRRPTLRVTRRPNGSWSVEKLLPLPPLSDRPPAVTIENGTIEIFDPLKNPSSTLTLRDVNLTLSAPDPSCPAPHARKLQGTFSADHLRQVDVEGVADLQARTWTIGGAIEGLDISPELRDALPGPLAAKLAVLGELRGQGTLRFRLGYDPSAESCYRYDLSGRLVRGRMDDPRLPYPLTDMRTSIRLNNAGFAIDELAARSGQATISMSARQAGFVFGQCPLALEAEIRQLNLDSQLLSVLPQPLRENLESAWYKYYPTGQVDATVKLSHDGRTWRPEVYVRCADVAFTYHKFQYRLEHGKGNVELKNDTLRVDLTAYSGSQPVEIDAEVHHPTSAPTGWFEARGEKLQMDEKLLIALNSLNEKLEAVVRSLHPGGTLDFHVRIRRDEPRGPLHKDLGIGLNRCSVRFEKFPYPLSNVCGTISMQDDHWTFHDLEGTNDQGRVTCEGFLIPSQQGPELSLWFAATDVPLEEELRDALPPNVRRAWNDLRPQGTVDLRADVRYLPKQKKLGLGVRAEPQSDALQGSSTSIEPLRFPYRLENLRGVLVYRDGRVTFEDFRAEHGPVKATAGGRFDFLPDGSWRLQLDGLSVDRLRFDDRELIQALPGRLKKAILELKPDGSLHLRGSLSLQGGAEPADPLHSQWDLVLFYQGNIDCVIELQNIHGSMTLAGGFDGRTFYCGGELAVDSLTFKDYQFTEVRGPLWIEDRQVLFGSWVAHRQNARRPRNAQQQPRPLSAKLFGGIVQADHWIALGPEPSYGLHAALSGADLSRYAREVVAGQQALRGKVFATVDLGGAGRSIHGMQGHGKIRLRDADVYELPVMIALLKILSIRQPDQTAFSESNIDFNVQGKHVYFQRIDFDGDAISLRGRGKMDSQSNVALTFRAQVGRGEVNVPVFKELLSGASEQIMQIHVGGTPQNPVIRKVPFPGVNQALQQLEDGLDGRAGAPGLLPSARQWLPTIGGRDRNKKR